MNITGDANVFHSGLDCEIMALKNASSELVGSTASVDLTLTSESCDDLEQFAFASGKYFSEWGLVSTDGHCKDNSTRLLMSFGTTTELNSSDIPLDAIKASGILCTVHFGVSPGVVVLNVNESVVETPNITFDPSKTSTPLPGVKPADIIGAISDGWQSMGSEGTVGYLADYFLLLMPNTTREDLSTNPELLAQGANLFVQAFSAQLANTYFVEPANHTIPGSMTTMEDRLVLRTVTFGLIEGLLGLLSILTLSLILLAPRDCVPQDPGPVEGVAAILARSPGVLSMLQGTGASNLRTIKRRLVAAKYTTQPSLVAAEDEFGITDVQENEGDGLVHGREFDSNKEDREGERNIDWYRPIAVTLPAKISVVLAPIIMIIVLETLYQQSRKHNGVCDVAVSEYIHYTYTYIPVVLLVSIGLMFSSLDFSAKIFQPYALLRQGGASSRALADNYLGKVSLHSILSAIRRKHTAVTSSSLGMMIAPGLTIAASGLFWTEAFPRDYQIQISQTSSFNSTFPTISFGGGANSVGWDMANLLLLDESLGEPLFTYDTLAFPDLSLLSLPSDVPQDTTQKRSVATQVTAYRARSNCTSDPIYNLTYSAREEEYPSRITKVVSFNFSLPAACNLTGTTITIFDDNDSSNITDRGANYFGQWTDLYPTGTSDAAALAASAHACPSTAIIYGHVVDGRPDHLTPLLCTPYLETLSASILLNAADLSFNRTAPPTPIPSTAAPARSLALLRDLGRQLYFGWAQPWTTQGPVRINATRVDGFFAALLHSPGGAVAPAALATEARLVAAVDALYARVVAQLLNTMRTAGGGEEAPAPATLTVPRRVRLLQSAVSTRILEGLLAALALCAVVAYAALETREVLPKNPCSVGAVASLVASGEMLGKCFPEGAEWVGPAERRAKGAWEGVVVSLGWWPGGRFGVDVGVAERDGGGREEGGDGKGPEVEEMLVDGGSAGSERRRGRWKWFGRLKG